MGAIHLNDSRMPSAGNQEVRLSVRAEQPHPAQGHDADRLAGEATLPGADAAPVSCEKTARCCRVRLDRSISDG